MSSNSNRLKEEVNILDVITEYISDIKKKGAAYFFRCPNPSHDDKNASCYCKEGWKNVRCCSCGYYATAIDLIQTITGYDFQTACDELARIEGYPEWYDVYTKQDKSVLTPADLHFLGLSGINNIVDSKAHFNKIVFAAYNKKKEKGVFQSELEALKEKLEKL